MSHVRTQSEWEEEMSEKILQLVRHELYLDLRYMEPALSALSYRKSEGLLTFATDGVCLRYCPEPLIRVFQSNAAFLDRAYLHVTLHCVFRHLWLAGGRDLTLWNLACDIAVEHVIDSMDKPSTRRILSWLRIRTYDALKECGNGISAAVIYRWLKGQGEEQKMALAREFYTDDHRFWPKEGEQDSPAVLQARQGWERAARQVMLEKSRGGGRPGQGEAEFAALVRAAKNKRSYADFLRKFAVFREEARLDPEEFDPGYYAYGFSLYGNLPLIEPLETRETSKIHSFVIVIDTSDSTSGELVRGFLRETHAVLSHKNSFFDTCSIRILQCDDKVRKDDVIRSGQDFMRLMEGFSLAGGGGTDFRPAFSYVEALRGRGEMEKPEGLLYFTDGKGVYPEKKPDYKTAFLFLNDYDESAVPPWAMRLFLDESSFALEKSDGLPEESGF